MLLFPAIAMADEDQLAFARTLGTVVEQGGKGIFKVTLDARMTPAEEYLRGTVMWHFDGWSDDVPALGPILSARVLSDEGGQTEFANTYAAYEELDEEELDEDEKARIAGPRVLHAMTSTQGGVFDDPSEAARADWARFPAKSHPLVWTHRSGRRSLLLGSSAEAIEGMDAAEGRALIERLKAWARQPRFVYRHEWTVGDMLMWDNSGVLHRVEAYRADSGRMMHRVTLRGEEAIA